MARRRAYPTRYTAGPYRVVELSLRRGFAVVDDHGRYALTHQTPTGRPVPSTYELPEAIRRMHELAADNSQ